MGKEGRKKTRKCKKGGKWEGFGWRLHSQWVYWSRVCCFIARQAPLSMEFSRQEYWSAFPFPTPENLPDPGIKLTSLAPTALASGFLTTVTWEAPIGLTVCYNLNSVHPNKTRLTSKLILLTSIAKLLLKTNNYAEIWRHAIDEDRVPLRNLRNSWEVVRRASNENTTYHHRLRF